MLWILLVPRPFFEEQDSKLPNRQWRLGRHWWWDGEKRMDLRGRLGRHSTGLTEGPTWSEGKGESRAIPGLVALVMDDGGAIYWWERPRQEQAFLCLFVCFFAGGKGLCVGGFKNLRPVDCKSYAVSPFSVKGMPLGGNQQWMIYFLTLSCW